MRVRTGHGPNDWREEGPQSVVAHANKFASFANTGDRMIPTLRYFDQPTSAAETAKRQRYAAKRQEATRIEREAKPPPPVCGAPMKRVGDTCARGSGHRDCHLSRFAMDNDRDARRAHKRTA